MIASTISLPSGEGTLMRTLPSSTAIMLSPEAPIRKMVSPAAKLRMRARAASSLRSFGLSPRNNTHSPSMRRALSSVLLSAAGMVGGPDGGAIMRCRDVNHNGAGCAGASKSRVRRRGRAAAGPRRIIPCYQHVARRLKRLVAAQRRHHALAEQPDRAHHIVGGEVGEIELAEKHVEQPGLGGGADLARHGVRRTDEHQVVLHQVIGVEQIAHDFRGARLAAADEFL